MFHTHLKIKLLIFYAQASAKSMNLTNDFFVMKEKKRLIQLKNKTTSMNYESF